jgi:hypothetical protein
MPNEYVEKLTIESVVFRVPQEYAALVVYFDSYWGKMGTNASVWTLFPDDRDLKDKRVATVPSIMKILNGEEEYVSVFPRLEPGTYIVTVPGYQKTITLFPGYISEVYFYKRS